MATTHKPSQPEQKISQTALQSVLSTWPSGKPVNMLNLIRFNASANYSTPSESDVDKSPCSGRDAYFQRYLPVVGPMLAELGAELAFVGKAWESVVEGNETWDAIVIVRYPNPEAFVKLTKSEDYQKFANPHRVAATETISLVPVEVD